MMESIMSAYVIDIGRLVKGVDKRLFSGRSNGEDAFKHFSLNKATPNDTVELLVPEDVVISSSYFLGMLEKIMRMYPSVDEYKKHVDESRLKGNNLKEYHRALKRGFHKNVGLF